VIESSYESAHKKALKEHKMLIVFLTKKSCSHCNNTLEKIILNKNVTSLIGKKALFCIVTKEQKESYPIEMLYTLEYPTLFFLDSTELFVCDALKGNIKLSQIQNCLLTQ